MKKKKSQRQRGWRGSAKSRRSAQGLGQLLWPGGALWKENSHNGKGKGNALDWKEMKTQDR